jgi:signal transduction histidine kinase
VAQALDVLLENALEHGAGTTRLEAGVSGGRYRLAVSDDGAGVAPALEARIFEREVSTAGSTGIGLSLARALVEADGGRLVLARPRPACFEILIPQPRAAQSRSSSSASVGHAAAARRASSSSSSGTSGSAISG